MTDREQTERFTLISDDDGHWYVCPVDRLKDAEDYFAAVYRGEHADEPDFLRAVGGAPSLVSFTDPVIL